MNIFSNICQTFHGEVLFHAAFYSCVFKLYIQLIDMCTSWKNSLSIEYDFKGLNFSAFWKVILYSPNLDF